MCQVDCEVANRPLFKVTPKHSCEVPSIVEVVQVATWELQTAGLSLELHAPDAHPPTGCFLDGVYSETTEFPNSPKITRCDEEWNVMRNVTKNFEM